jgi:tripartite-type tricarboxylate transporter receptor subunit TctC
MKFRLGRLKAILAAAVSLTLAAAVLLAPAAQAQTQNWPTRPIRMVVPFAAGGITDVLIRVLSDKLGSRVGQAIIVDDRPGANGLIGADLVAKSAPDGYTILPVGGSSYTTTFFKELPFDFHRDFTPISLFWVGGYLFLVNANSPAKTLKDFVALAKANPGKFNTGSAGAPNLMMTALFTKVVGIDMLNIAYKGNAQTATALMAGDIQLVLDPPTSHKANLEAGKIRALAISGPGRLPSLPDVPTLAEAGFPNVNGTYNGGAWAPTGTPKPIIDRLNAEFRAILEMPDVKEKTLTIGGVIIQTSTPEGLRKFIQDDQRFWAEAAKVSGYKPE